MFVIQHKWLLALGVLMGLAWGCSDDPVPENKRPPGLEVKYDSNSNQLQVTVYPRLNAGETLHTRIRNGGPGELDCRSMASVG